MNNEHREIPKYPNLPKQVFYDYAEEIETVLRRAALHAVKIHKAAGVPLAIWRDGEVALVSAEEIERSMETSEHGE